MIQPIEELFQSTPHNQYSDRLSQALKGGDQPRLELAVFLAETEDHHHDCEAAGTKPDQRSFCFHHQKVTEKSFLLLHGFTACPYEMRELGEELYNQGHNVFGARLAGHGTTVADFAKYGASDWENSAKQGLGVSCLLGRQTIVIGESMGGALAAILGRDFPELINKLILCAPAFRCINRMAALSRWGLVQKLIPQNDMGVQYDWQRPYWYGTIPTSRVAELIKVAGKGLGTGPKIKAPTLIIHALDDQIIRYQGSRNFYRTLSGLAADQKQLILFPNGHHNLTIDLNPRKNEVFEWVNQFIQK